MSTKSAKSARFPILQMKICPPMHNPFSRWVISILFIGTLIPTLVLGIARSVYAAEDAPSAIYLPLVTTPEDTSGFSSDVLIEKARQAGTIDDETALLYRVYATFEDQRLPAAYRGDDTQGGASMVLHEVQARLNTLSASTQSTLAPFLLPPTAENSWLEMREASLQGNLGTTPAASNAKVKWLTTCHTDSDIKVWYQERYPEDAASARQVCELVRGEIWPRLVSLMGRKPLDDGAESNNGGDAQLDFYLVSARTNNVVYRGCDNSPSYITVHRTRWNKALLTAAIMGAFLDSYDSADCMEYMWLYAATRTWSIDYVYPSDQWEHHYADDFMAHTDLPLDTYPVVPLDVQNEIGEGAYLWVWYATNILKTAKETVPLWWQGATNPDSLATVNGVMGNKGFEKEWKNFSGVNWNNEPVDIYKESDNMSHSTKLTLDENVVLNGAQDRTYELDGAVAPLAAHTFRFEFNDASVRSVLFYNPFNGGAEPTAAVNAYYKLADQSWHIEEWTDQYGQGFCRDFVAERVEELIIVISNHEWQDPSNRLEPAKPPRLNVTNVACRGWEFEGTATWIGTGEEYSIQDTATVKATFMRFESEDVSGAGSLTHFQATEGSGTWSHTGQHVNCGGSGSGSFEVSGGNNSAIFMLTKATDHATSTEYVPGDRRYNGFATEGTQWQKLTATYTCKGTGSTHEAISASAVSWFLSNPLFETDEMVNADGKTVMGSHTRSTFDGFNTDTYTWEWTLTALPPE